MLRRSENDREKSKEFVKRYLHRSELKLWQNKNLRVSEKYWRRRFDTDLYD